MNTGSKEVRGKRVKEGNRDAMVVGGTMDGKRERMTTEKKIWFLSVIKFLYLMKL